jgi:GNAT superfamily N-acetyltransferase
MNSITDTAMTAYFQYLLVRPDYQGKGIGKALTRKMLEVYADIPRKVLISMEDKVNFYTSCGFVQHTDKSPMFLSSL